MKIYLAAPFTKKLNHENLVDSEHQQKLLSIEKKIQGLGHNVFLPHRDLSKWGKVKPEEIIHLWEQTIRKCDLLLALIGFPDSPGTCIEIGIALAHKKPIILLNENSESLSASLNALQALENIKLIKFHELNELFKKLESELK